LIGHTTGRLLEAGALDVYCTAIAMKKNRPGTLISVICRLSDVRRLEEILFRESTTFGIRRHLCQRSILARKHETVTTPFGPIRIKVGYFDGEAVSWAVEFADCQAAALQHGTTVKQVAGAALAAYQQK
jgi:pyridinium-3,5-bisthiocarboxylic acid mononucleotide nickel chelatase